MNNFIKKIMIFTVLIEPTIIFCTPVDDLFYAINTKNQAAAQAAIEAGADVAAVRDNQSVLQYALNRKLPLHFIAFLLMNGASTSINEIDSLGFTILDFEMREQIVFGPLNLCVIYLLQAYGAKTHYYDFVAEQKYKEFEHKLNSDEGILQGLLCAIESNNIQLLNYLIKKRPKLINVYQHKLKESVLEALSKRSNNSDILILFDISDRLNIFLSYEIYTMYHALLKHNIPHDLIVQIIRYNYPTLTDEIIEDILDKVEYKREIGWKNRRQKTNPSQIMHTLFMILNRQPLSASDVEEATRELDKDVDLTKLSDRHGKPLILALIALLENQLDQPGSVSDAEAREQLLGRLKKILRNQRAQMSHLFSSTLYQGDPESLDDVLLE